MSRFVRLIVVLAAVLALVGAAPSQAAPPEGGYIVVLRDDADPRSVAQEHAANHGAVVAHVYEHALKGYAARIPAERLDRVRADPRVWFVSEDREVQAFAQTAPTGVRRIGASSDAVTQTLVNNGSGIGVAVIDTGIDLAHSDLSPVESGTSCLRGRRSPNDDNGHGSHVAGTIAARDNGVGVVGVAPEAKLYPVKVLDSRGSGTWSQVICGVDWVTANAASIKVANMSLGGSGTVTPSNADCSNANNDALHTAICRSVKKGVTYVAAAGNSAADSSGFVPAGYDEVITVSALSDSDGKAGGSGGAPTCRSGEQDDWFASFSNFGAPVDIAGPGVCIYSTYNSGGYATLSGTSMAAPHVAGAAALYVKNNPTATPAEVKAGLVGGQEQGPISGDPDSSKEGVVKVA